MKENEEFRDKMKIPTLTYGNLKLGIGPEKIKEGIWVDNMSRKAYVKYKAENAI